MKKNYIKIMPFILILAMIFSLAACNNDSEEIDSDENGENGEVETVDGEWTHENRGIVLNLNAAASTSDPFAHANVNDREWLLNCYEPLFCYNGITGENEPRVGKGFEISEDGLTYTVEIFDNIYFQNGKHCTAEDIKKSYEYGQDSAYNYKFSGIVDKVEVVDDYTVDIILKEPSAPFLSNSDQIFILDTDEVAEQGEDFGKIPNTAGTGAYYIDQYDPAVEIVLKRHEKFHREIDGRPIPEVTFKVMTDSSAALMAFEAGDLDFIGNILPSNFPALEESDDFNTSLGQTTQVIYFSMNPQNNEYLADKKVRQAIAYAVDYEGMLNIGMEGYGNVSGKIAYAPYTIAAPAEDSGIIYNYDKDKAIELLKEAGYEDGGIDVGDITCIAGRPEEKMAQVMQSNLEEIGITMGINSMEEVTAISEMMKGTPELTTVSYYMMMDYDYITGIMDIDGNEQSTIKLVEADGVETDKIYDLFREARKHTDEEKRREIYTEMEEYLMDGATVIPILHTAVPYAWNKDLNINTNKPYTYHYSQFWDAYWE